MPKCSSALFSIIAMPSGCSYLFTQFWTISILGTSNFRVVGLVLDKSFNESCYFRCLQNHHHHHHHVPEGLGVFPVPWCSRWSWSLHLFLGRPMFLRPFGLYCSACFGSLFVSILQMPTGISKIVHTLFGIWFGEILLQSVFDISGLHFTKLSITLDGGV
jgi:hypothetical protein